MLSAKTSRALEDAGLTVDDLQGADDAALLGIPGVGPAALKELRAVVGAPSLAVVDLSEQVRPDPVPAAVESVGAPVVAAPGCTCPQPWRVTRTRQARGRIERYCDVCGAVMGAVVGR